MTVKGRAPVPGAEQYAAPPNNLQEAISLVSQTWGWVDMVGPDRFNRDYAVSKVDNVVMFNDLGNASGNAVKIFEDCGVWTVVLINRSPTLETEGFGRAIDTVRTYPLALGRNSRHERIRGRPSESNVLLNPELIESRDGKAIDEKICDNLMHAMRSLRAEVVEDVSMQRETGRWRRVRSAIGWLVGPSLGGKPQHPRTDN